MTERTETQALNRIDKQPGEVINRTSSFTFTFNGKTYSAHPGDTIASALSAAGVKVLSRSFKYHRPRGLMCCSGHCPNCLVQVAGDHIAGEPNVRACTRPVEPEMKVEAQNAWPSLERDIMSLTRFGDRLLPVGFYYKAFIRPRFLWPAFEHLLRKAAGLGKIDATRAADTAGYNKQYIHADVAVVGGGPAGLSSALAAAGQGARVVLFDDNQELGGHLRFSPSDQGENSPLAELLDKVSAHPGLSTFTGTTVLGWYEDNWLSAAAPGRLYKIRARSALFATGAYEQPLIFDNNDLPGILLGSAVRRLLHLYGVVPGRRVVIVTANDDGWAVAHDLQQAGLSVVAVVDQRFSSDSPLVDRVGQDGAAIFWGHTIQSATGSPAVDQVAIVPVGEQGRVSADAKQTLDCDLVAVSVGWTPANGLIYQAGGRAVFDEGSGEFLPQTLPPRIFVAGRVNGAHDVETAMAEGRLMGLRAAAHAGVGQLPDDGEQETIEAVKAVQPRRTSTLVSVPGKKKRFVCLCEDVTVKDLETAIAEGYDSIELLKRYSTISMGPCQGKMCSTNTIHLCARANGRPVEETGTTTARPPMKPVSLGVLAGQNMEPVMVTPVHDWHLAHGAKMMVAGLWLRPEHYGDPVAEVMAVRQRVGLIDVSTLGKYRWTGPGVPRLLERVYTNKWQNLPAGRVRYGVMCNDEGIVLDDGVTARVGDEEWYTTTTSSGASAIYEWLQWWIQSGWGAGVHLGNITEANAAFNLAGPEARAVLQGLADADLGSESFPYLHVRDMTLAGVPCRLLRIGFTGELSYEIHCPAGFGQPVWEAIMEAGQAFGIRPFGVEAQRILRLEKGHIIVGQDTDALSDPLSADMAWAVKLDKADFLGRRTLKRLAENGIRQRLVGFKMVQPGIVPDEGLQIVGPGQDGKLGIIGWVTSSRYSPTLDEAIGLCWLPADVARQPGATFTIWMDSDLAKARVHHGPFYDPDGRRLRG